MLPREHRLRSSRDFQQVYRSGRSWAHPVAALHVLPRPSGQRMGIAVSKKVGKAVQRNRVRRRLREILRATSPRWKQGFDAVVVARAAAAEAEYSELAAAIAELGRRAGLVREPEAPPDSLYSMRPSAPRPRRDDSHPAGKPESGRGEPA